MIERSKTENSEVFRASDDVFIYALGFETRSTHLVSRVNSNLLTLAIQMPETNLHRYQENLTFARRAGHRIVDPSSDFIGENLLPIIARQNGPLRIGFDISSVNRPLLFSVLLRLSDLCQENSLLTIYYTPAAYSEPDWQFPQIESIGPVNLELAGYDSDPVRPLCLILGLGFEPGTSMGIISQLEPRAAYCFWGTGVDKRFDDAVKRANFEFDFTGFNTRSVPYLIHDAMGTYSVLESLTYGLVNRFNLVCAPMGPKIFAFHTALLALKYPGQVAVWRVQQRRTNPPDAMPGPLVVVISLDTSALRRASKLRMNVLSPAT